MGKCAAYWRAKDAGKDCGVPKPGTITRQLQDGYQYGIVADLVALGAKEDEVYELLHYTTCVNNFRTPSILKLRRDSPVRKKLLDHIFIQISQGKKVDYNFLNSLAEKNPELKYDNWSKEEYRRHFGRDKFQIREHEDDIDLILPQRIAPVDITKVWERRCAVQKISRTVEKKNLLNFCNSGQVGILNDMTVAGYGDDEYAAFCIALKWAAERLESEKAAKGATN